MARNAEWGSTRKARPAALSGGIVGMVAFLMVLATLGDPGITSDEPLDVRVGRHYLEHLDALGRLYTDLFRGNPAKSDADLLFRDNAQHPPLGRVLVGLASVLAAPFESFLGGTDAFSVHAARLAPAAAYGVLIGLLTWFGGRRFGVVVGLGAGIAFLLMPRAFAHGHFATLDTLLCLFWVLALLTVVVATDTRRPTLAITGAGLVWGLALLTKIHAWLLPPVVILWLLVRLPWRKAVVGAIAWTTTGLLTFLSGWPWLWFDTVGRLRGFLGTSVDRLPLKVRYFGRVYLDHDVPWHYPWVYFAITVPIGLQLLGAIGIYESWRHRRSDPLPLVLSGTVLLWLLLFSTKAPVYDGERLFLVAFPLWALIIGLGCASCWRWAGPRRWLHAALGLWVMSQGLGLIALHPFGLSYYNLLVGGLPGASRLGLELTYWGDSVDSVLLNDLGRRVDPGDTVALAPTLHHVQPLASTTETLYNRGIILQDESAVPTANWIVVYRRSAYWTDAVRRLVREHPPVAVRSRQGTWLSGTWRRPPPENDPGMN